MANFSKRHYEVVAGVITTVKRRVGRNSFDVEELQYELSRTFTADNPRFDAERFNKACEPGEGGK